MVYQCVIIVFFVLVNFASLHLPAFLPLLKIKKCGCVTVLWGWWVSTLWEVIILDLKLWFCFASRHIFWKEKKKKRKSSFRWRFQMKSSFFEKILPKCFCRVSTYFEVGWWIGEGKVEIFSKTQRAWTLLFETVADLYFLFIYFFLRRMFLFSFFWERDLESGNQTPPSTARKKKVVPLFQGQGTFFADEERSGGVAAIEQPP